MQFSVAHLTIKGIAPYSASHQHDLPMLEGESHDAYDKRTWRSKLNTETRDGKLVAVLPAHGIMQCFTAGAKYSKKQIPGQGKATWTAKFASGITVPANPVLLGADGKPVDPETVDGVVISANTDGVRGSGKRVPRKFPIIPAWSAEIEVWILDPIVIERVFRDIVGLAGMFTGIGRFRPEKGGINGRFVIAGLAWEDNRALELEEAA
jgi:hypothetical protein